MRNSIVCSIVAFVIVSSFCSPAVFAESYDEMTTYGIINEISDSSLLLTETDDNFKKGKGDAAAFVITDETNYNDVDSISDIGPEIKVKVVYAQTEAGKKVCSITPMQEIKKQTE